MRITKDPEERKQEIMDTAIQLFYEKGYEKTSIADIAKAMHVALGLCYRYFPSKEALFEGAIEQYAQRQVDQMAEILNRPGLSLIEIVEKMPTFMETEADGSAISGLCHGPESEKIHLRLTMKICAKICPLVQKQLELAKQRGEIEIEDSQTIASFCVYGQLGILLDQEIPKEQRVKRIKAFLIQLLERFMTR